jgi:DNA-directed RNA polymerase sigma subunit (sigma70/sigma32)
VSVPIIISNPVPTPEEMAEILGMSPERVKAIRAIMDAPVRAKNSAGSSKTRGKAAAKKASRSQTRKAAAKK